jgi:transposase-like protein
MNNKFKPKVSKEDRERAAELYLNSDYTLKQIAEQHGVTIPAVGLWVKKYKNENGVGFDD